MQVLRDVPALRAQVQAWRGAGDAIALVPTMGALHAGHIALVQSAQRDGGRVIVTIFVNPAQFNNPSDLAKYPRTEAADFALLQQAGVDAVFAPSADVVYPPGFSTHLRMGAVAKPLEGAARPGHFDGVATVVAKLFGMAQPDRVYFGEKDWQQLQVVRRLSLDLNLPVQIIGCPTLRDADGLAMSSRNIRLGPAARAIAPQLYRIMQDTAAALRAGDDAALDQARAQLLAAGFGPIDYIAACDAGTLLPLTIAAMAQPAAQPARLLAAAWLDGVRLIDNIPL
jgi:pantoate--beta-alanine ligase